jgi:hypothetical protein
VVVRSLLAPLVLSNLVIDCGGRGRVWFNSPEGIFFGGIKSKVTDMDTGMSGQHARRCTVTLKGEITRCIFGSLYPPGCDGWSRGTPVSLVVCPGTLSLLRKGAEISPFSRYCWVVAVVTIPGCLRMIFSCQAV